MSQSYASTMNEPKNHISNNLIRKQQFQAKHSAAQHASWKQG